MSRKLENNFFFFFVSFGLLFDIMHGDAHKSESWYYRKYYIAKKRKNKINFYKAKDFTMGGTPKIWRAIINGGSILLNESLTVQKLLYYVPSSSSYKKKYFTIYRRSSTTFSLCRFLFFLLRFFFQIIFIVFLYLVLSISRR